MCPSPLRACDRVLDGRCFPRPPLGSWRATIWIRPWRGVRMSRPFGRTHFARRRQHQEEGLRGERQELQGISGPPAAREFQLWKNPKIGTDLFGLHYHPLLVIALIAVLAPLANELPLRFRTPSVVLEIIFGILVGPQVLGWVRDDEATEVLWKIGLCSLFLLAGIEIDLTRIRGRPLELAVKGWVFSLALGAGAAFFLWMLGLVRAPLLVAMALSTTAIGALLPILRDGGELSREFGILALAAGATGEFAPLLLLSLLPIGAGQSAAGNALAVVVFAVVAVMTGLIVLSCPTPQVSPDSETPDVPEQSASGETCRVVVGGTRCFFAGARARVPGRCICRRADCWNCRARGRRHRHSSTSWMPSASAF